jgi:hypothetical protein
MKTISKNTYYGSTAFKTENYNNKIYLLFLEHPKNSEKFPDPENYHAEAYKEVSGVGGPNTV